MTMVLNGTSGVTTNSGTLISATTIGVGGTTPSASGAGITFPATQSASTDANTLDDYEEGTWTPSLSFETGQVGSFTYTTQSGKYTKIGNIVRVSINISCTGKPSAGSVLRVDLPFTPAVNAETGGYIYDSGGITYTGHNLGAGATMIVLSDYGANLLSVSVMGSGRAYTDPIDVGALAASFTIRGIAVYQV